jgi:cell wall-associated NlpC family hydrolase
VRFTLAILALIPLACATPRPTGPDGAASSGSVPATVASRPSPVEEVLEAARTTLGQSRPRIDGERVPTDCSGYLHALFARAGIDLFAEGRPSDNGVRAIVRFVERHGRLFRGPVAAPGDLVFFDNSYDRNGDGRLDDRLTHAGLVEQVLQDGTMLIVHATNHGIVREPMNLVKPHDAFGADGRALNAPLRRKDASDGPRTPRLMSELFAGFGSVFQRERLAGG